MWKLSWPRMFPGNGTVQLVGSFDASFFAFGHLMGDSPRPCHRKTGSAGRLCCEVIYTCPVAVCRIYTPRRDVSTRQESVEVLKIYERFLDHIFAEYLHPVSIVFRFVVTGGIYAVMIDGSQ